MEKMETNKANYMNVSTATNKNYSDINVSAEDMIIKNPSYYDWEDAVSVTAPSVDYVKDYVEKATGYREPEYKPDFTLLTPNISDIKFIHAKKDGKEVGVKTIVKFPAQYFNGKNRPEEEVSSFTYDGDEFDEDTGVLMCIVKYTYGTKIYTQIRKENRRIKRVNEFNQKIKEERERVQKAEKEKRRRQENYKKKIAEAPLEILKQLKIFNENLAKLSNNSKQPEVVKKAKKILNEKFKF